MQNEANEKNKQSESEKETKFAFKKTHEDKILFMYIVLHLNIASTFFFRLQKHKCYSHFNIYFDG